MSLPALYVQPQTSEQWKAWSFNHAVNHYDWISAAQGKQQTPVILKTNAATSAGNNVLTFASTDSLQVQGVIYEMYIADQTTPGAIPSGTTIEGSNATEIEMSANVASPGVGSGDSIAFTQVTPAQLTQYLLDPIDLQNLAYWLYNHQAAHNQINAVLGTQGYDLLDLNWNDPDQFQEWLNLNATEHVRISALLGVN